MGTPILPIHPLLDNSRKLVLCESSFFNCEVGIKG